MEPTVLKEMQHYFGNKSFLKFQAQGFDQYPLTKAYQKDEESFIKTVKSIPINEVPANANVINSHTIYKIKTLDDK